MAKSRVSITVWKTWKGSRHYTPSQTSSRTVWRIYALIKKAISTFYFSDGLFYKRNSKHFFRVPIRHRNTRGSLGERENESGNTSPLDRMPQGPKIYPINRDAPDLVVSGRIVNQLSGRIISIIRPDTSLIIQTLHIAPWENGRERRVRYLTPLIDLPFIHF